jgi:hypothetical protein
MAATETVVQYFKIKNSNHVRFISVGIGLLLGFIYWRLEHNISVLISSYFVALGFYSLVMKVIKNKIQRKNDTSEPS